MRDKFDACYNELCHRKPSDDRWTVTELRFANDYLKYLQLLDFTAWLLVIWMLTFIAGIFGFLAWLFYSSAIGIAFVIASGLALCPITLHGAHSFFKLLPLSKKLNVLMRKVKDGWEYDLYSR